MVKHAQQLDWQSVDIVLIWKSPRTVKKTADIYLKLWGLIHTINTTTAELQRKLHDCTNPKLKPILAKTLTDKQRLYPSDNFPLIAFHPTRQSYHRVSLKTDVPFFLTIVFGGEHIHQSKAWLAWFQHRLTLDNTGFVFLEPAVWHEHHAILPNIDLLDYPQAYEQQHPEFNPMLERSILLDMPTNLTASQSKDNDKQTLPNHSVAYDISHTLIRHIHKRLCQWFPTQVSIIDQWMEKATPYLLASPLSLYQLHEQHHIQSTSKSTTHANKTQFHHGMVGWLTMKDAWTQIDELWKILFSIHLLGQRTHINGLGYILPEDKAPHAPPTLMQQYFTNPRSIHNAVNEVLFSYDLEPELDRHGNIMEENALTQRLHDQLLHSTYQPQPTVALLIEKPHGGHRRIEQLTQQDMMVHRLLFYTFAPIIDKYQSPMSLGYRKGYSREMARQKIQQLLDDGYSWVIEADIEDFFNSIPLDRLWQQLQRILPEREKDSIELLKSLMQVGYILGNHVHEQPRTHGLMQGSPLSPILANLYLSQLDEHISEHPTQQPLALVRYADDFLIFCRSNTDAQTTLTEVQQYLQQLGLNLSLAKTAITPVNQGFEFLGYRFDSEGSQDKSIVPVLKQRKPLMITGSRKFIGVNGSAVEIRQKGLAKKSNSKKSTDNEPSITPSNPPKKLTKVQQQQSDLSPLLQNQLVQVIPLRRISQLIILGNHGLSSPLLSVCAKEKISVHFVNQWGFQVGTLTPINADYFAISAKQYYRHQALKPSERLAIACDIVCAKVGNYQTWINNSYRKGDAMTIKRLDSLIQQATQATQISQLMGYEGQASKLCFERLQQCFIPEQKDAFSSKRRSRGGKDRLNSVLNFGYYWLFTRISSLLRSHGLNPYLSFLHESGQSFETLTYDVMELFRVQIDKTVLRLINRKQLKADDFYLHEHKGWQMTNQAIHLYSNQLQATFASQLNQTYLEDIVLMQIRTIQNWATDGKSLIWFYWYSDKDNPAFSAPDDNHDSMVIDDVETDETVITDDDDDF